MKRTLIFLFTIILLTQSQSTPRYYPNPMPDYTPNDPLTLPQSTLSKMKSLHDQYLTIIQNSYPTYVNKNGFDCMTGTCGVALSYLRLYKNTNNREYLETARKYIDISISSVSDRDGFFGFLRGANGVWTTGAIIYDLWGDASVRDMCLGKLKGSFKDIASRSVSYDELDTGKAGLLMCGLFVNDFFGAEVISKEDILSVGYLLFENGVRNSVDGVLQFNSTFHDYFLWGQNHGSTGVLMQFFRIPEMMQNQTVSWYVRNTLDNYLKIQFPSGNFPTPLKAPFPSTPDVLVQWCHGSPGFIPVLAEGYKFFEDKRYLDSMNRAVDNVWEKGLITKGLMLGHGISGNGYMMVYPYQIGIRDPKYLYRFLKFQEYVVLHEQLSDPDMMRQPTPNAFMFIGSSYFGALTIWSDILNNATTYDMVGFEIKI